MLISYAFYFEKICKERILNDTTNSLNLKQRLNNFARFRSIANIQVYILGELTPGSTL